MKRVINISIFVLAVLALFAACKNPFVTKILPDRNGNGTTFTVTFHRNYNASDTDPSPQIKTVASPATTIDALPAQPTQENYAFASWNTERDGSGTVFTVYTKVEDNINVYAQWNYAPPGSFTVTFDRNGGEVDANPATKVVISPVTNVVTLPTPPTRTGHTFAGWNTESNGSGSPFTATTEVTSHITVYAQWTPQGQPPAAAIVDFEDDAAGATTKYTFTSGTFDPHEFEIAADPANAGEKSLKMTTGQGNDSGNLRAYNQAAVIPINITDALSTYKSFRFRFYLNGAGTLAADERKISVYVADAADKFIRYGFGNAADAANQFADLLLGEIEPDYDKTGQWVDYAINFTSPGSAISALQGNVYVAVGINHDASITYYLDDLTFSKQELIKQDGAALAGPVTVSGITPSGVTIDTVTAPGNGQTVEYAVSTDTNAPVGGWQDSNVITGLTASTSYYAWARSKSNALYNAGVAIRSAATFTTDAKHAGAALTGTITTTEIKHNRITVNAVTPPGNGQSVEYSISTSPTVWQDGRIFTGLTPTTTYTISARAKENGDYFAGVAISESFTTTVYTPPLVDPSVVDFETPKYTTSTTVSGVTGQGSSTRTIVVDPANPSEQSLRITSTSWNNGAIIPINLPFALENYESFTFRYRLGTTMGSSNRGNGIFVYAMSSTSGLPSGQLGNNDNASYFNCLLGNVDGEADGDIDYTHTNQWVDWDFDLTKLTLSTAMKALQGDIFLVIGWNSGQEITYYLDDLTFNIDGDFEPTPIISPTTATFVQDAQAAIPVTMNLYGKTLTSITDNGTALSQGTDYTRSGDVITLQPSYFSGKPDGNLTLTFNFSGGSSKTITITIRAVALLTAYNFVTTNPGSVWSNVSSSAEWENGVGLKVTLSAKNGLVILPFTLEAGTNLSQYNIYAKIAGISGSDMGWKPLRVEVAPSGTFGIGRTNTQVADFNNLLNNTDERDATVSFDNNATTTGMTGEIRLGFFLYEANPPLQYRILELRLTKK